MTIEKLSRRDFLKASGVSTGGLALGAATMVSPVNVVAAAAPFPLSPETPKEALAFNLFVQIGEDDKVYIVAHRSEMGQGSRTGLPQIVADELNADWDKVVVVQARGDAAYGSQNTDGSRSVRDFYDKMREMGATAKVMLQHAAAATWDVPVEQCMVDNHRVINRTNKSSLSFGQLAAKAAQQTMPKPEDLVFKDKKDFRYIGKPVEIVDLDKIVTGKTVFGMDVQLPNMVFASTEHCPFLGGTIKSFDASEAKKVSGVIDVVEIKHKPLPAIFHPLAGLAVVATNTWAAMEGRKKLKIQWSTNEHQQHDSTTYLGEMLKALDTKPAKAVRTKGDVKTALSEANETLEATYTVPYLVHAPMEPMATAAIAKDDSIEVWASTQTPQAAQRELALRFSLKPEQVKVNVTLLGGGFGRKSKPDYVVEAALISKALGGRPVRLAWSREDDIRLGYYHAISAIRMRAGIQDDKQNTVSALQSTACYPSISSTWNINNEHPSNSELDLGLTNTPFDIANEEVATAPILSHTRIGWMRSVCNIQQAFAIGSFVDELAIKTKTKPVDMWMQLIGNDRKIDYKDQGYELSNYGQSMEDFPFESKRLKDTLTLVAKKAGVDKRTRKNEGWGLSCHYSFLTHVAVATRVKIEGEKIIVKEVHCAIDCGLAVNPDRVVSQMEGAMIFGLSAALMGEITFKNGEVEQSNFHDYEVLRMPQSPDIFIHLVDSDDKPRGVGEPGVPPLAPSLTNAIVAAGGRRIRHLPVKKHYSV